MSQGRTLRPGARTAGGLLLAALAVLNLAWIIRDFDKAATVTDAWWMWSGLLFRAQDGIWASSFVEPTLLVVYTVCAVTVLLSSSAAGVMVSAGVLTVLLRVPTLWNLNASWVQGGVSDGLRNKVLFSAIAMLVLAVALIVTAVAGRRRAADAGVGTGTSSSSGTVFPNTRDEAPAPPTRGGGFTASFVLAVTVVVLVSWEIHSASRQGWDLYSRHFTGDRSLVTLLAVPESWYGWALTLLCLTASVAAFNHSGFSRPLGMTVSGPLLGLGLFHFSFAVKAGLLQDFGALAPADQLRLCTAVFEVVAAFCVLAALTGRGDASSGASGAEPHSGTVGSFSSA